MIPGIDPVEALKIKRRIDKSNQVRTDMVEYIDSYLLDKYKNIDVQPGARINTETPAWAIDRLSILALKIYHMRQEVLRKDVDEAHRAACQQKLDVLLSQQIDLSTAIEELIEDIEAGRKYMKTYKQMKMYNDPALNPCFMPRKNKKLPRHLLVIRTSAMGDVAMLPHALRAPEGGVSRGEGDRCDQIAVPIPFSKGWMSVFWISKPAARTGVSGVPFGSPAKRPS